MRIIRLKEVIDSTGLARSTIYKYIAEGTFPKPVPLGDRCVGWVDSEVHDWILARIEERDLVEGTVVRAAGHLSVTS
ncbi:helix-turn-helix transcriptional regulator [Pseudomonas plecoglossicida]|uniref:helix-turn-helix transcriptional regulator n=1 Tax=Pseudomonas plecoglossicida TaxID=70775 RepID=UPI00051CE19F|nr:AlpA family transcriptional regulator [Pseudomonas plecoglossicida]KGK27601.1 AlpA family transcriptional regulator [Pseudomonas plecoglossicida]